ncbi:hypothetical protein [Stieleria varia]|uniref:Uncharacterized protein n=1 Tax=Stieleria varia TaxID=2528005 RepID=A0A5C6B1K1_9BACT|nr:hypothetical protein [Stieleria varia]TWU05760.1 hypothetical protein Pla52n_14750 [Stieleria varia]
MKRSRSDDDQQDSLDLLLDTVSNVFGGVMFLTLLAALLILARGSSSVDEPESEQSIETTKPVNTTLLEAEARRTAVALETQKRMLERLDPDGSLSEKVQRLSSLESTLMLARRHARRADGKLDSQEQARLDQQAAESDLEGQIEALEKEIAEQENQAKQMRSQSERTVQFRPLTRSQTGEAVLLLRYGRWYSLLTSEDPGSLNREDFFLLRDSGGVTRVTPKPHRGHPVNDASLSQLTMFLKANFSNQQYHVVIAVWDDSFTEFNPLKDALVESGYQYRTLPCDSSSRLSNQYAADAYVQ